MARYYRTPFASTGTRAAIPDAQQTDSTVSYTEGYGPEYELNPSTETGALDIERDKFNQALFDITDTLKIYYETGTPPFITSTDNGGTAFSYGYAARVRINNLVYQSLVANNTAPVTNTTNWAIYDPQFMTRGQTFAAAGVSTWTIPSGVRFVRVVVIGAGGGAGRDDSIGGGAGGGGGYAEGIIDLAGVSSVSVTVGAGGAGRTGSQGVGAAGGTSSFGAFISATGGGAGARWAGGGTGSGVGGLARRGLGCGHHQTTIGSTFGGGNGGGPGGLGDRSGTTGTAGDNATIAGGGGGGGNSGGNGGNGFAGMVSIQY